MEKREREAQRAKKLFLEELGYLLSVTSITAALHDRNTICDCSTIFLEYLMPLTSNLQPQALLRLQHRKTAALQHQLFLSLDLTRWVNCSTSAPLDRSTAELQVQFIGTEIAYLFIRDLSVKVSHSGMKMCTEHRRVATLLCNCDTRKKSVGSIRITPI